MPDTIPARLFERARTNPYNPAYYVKERGRWKPTNWRTYAGEVRSAAKSLMKLGVNGNGAVAILGFNRPEWVITDLAAICVGSYAAGVYTTCSAEETQYIVHHSEATVMLVENQHQADKVRAQRENLPLLKQVVAMRNAGDLGDDVMSWEEFMELGKEVAEKDLDKLLDALKPDGLATLIYTSGTTGPPKGVMLTNENLSWTAQQVVSTLDNRTDDCLLSFLPLSHIAEQVLTIHAPITFGGSIYFAESLDAVPENLKEVQPTIFFAVPRLWEKFHAKLNDRLEETTGLKEHLIKWVRGVCTEVTDYKNRGERLPFALELKYKAAQKLVLEKLKPALGLGRARFCVSAAAPISAELIHFFASLDIIIHEVYGQSEDTGPTTVNIEGRTKIGSVGPALPGVEVKIADDGEILVRGKNVSPGYFKDPEATAETFQSGWLHSGDLGEFDAQGFLYITGRKKDIIITAGGKNIAPKNIEASLKDHRLINEAVVIGDRRKYLTALVTLDEEAVQRLYPDVDRSRISEDETIKQEVDKAFVEVNRTLAQVETIKKWSILPRNLTIEHGELTPSLKVKRNKVNENFADIIESMY